MGWNPIKAIFPGVQETFDFFGDTIDSITGKTQQRDANAANRQIAQDVMAFQERMSSTAHQRQVKDLEAAGINPILSAKLGGASAPPGSQATVHPVPSATGGMISKSLEAAQGIMNLKQVNQSVAESTSREALNIASADVTREGAPGKLLGPETSKKIRQKLDSTAAPINKAINRLEERYLQSIENRSKKKYERFRDKSRRRSTRDDYRERQFTDPAFVPRYR